MAVILAIFGIGVALGPFIGGSIVQVSKVGELIRICCK